tara:strand:- start:595 stop:1113 length:519 start_codon:yes stop_codon:yes gene_type:complete
MKSINITGKNNIDKIIHNQDNHDNNKILLNKRNINYEEPKHKDQLLLINKYYMNQQDNMETNILREIKYKLTGYKNQDIKKHIYDKDKLITLDEIIEKLVISKLICFYCKDNVKVLFTIVRDNKQWSLDRIDNNICHSNDNTVICCLKCNLERRIQNSSNFKFTKQLKIKKI